MTWRLAWHGATINGPECRDAERPQTADEDGEPSPSPRTGEGPRCGAAGRGAGEFPTVLALRLSHLWE